MADTLLALIWKELLELVDDRRSRRGAVAQAAVSLLVLGVLVPIERGSVLTTNAVIPLFMLVVAACTSAIAAEAIAGERERKTLETLLALPLREAIVLLAKVLVASLYAFSVCGGGLLLSVVVAAVARPGGVLRWSIGFSFLGGIAAAAFATAVCATFISLRLLVARSAQQISTLATMALIGATLAAWSALNISVTPMTILLASGAGTGIGAAGLFVAARCFKRELLVR